MLADGSAWLQQGNITAWKKKEGEEFAAGDVLCEVETDKVRSKNWQLLQVSDDIAKL